jgi:hypothetical protein
MNAMKAPSRGALARCVGGEAQLEQLIDAEHGVLTRAEGHDRRIKGGRVAKAVYTTGISTRPPSRPPRL